MKYLSLVAVLFLAATAVARPAPHNDKRVAAPEQEKKRNALLQKRGDDEYEETYYGDYETYYGDYDSSYGSYGEYDSSYGEYDSGYGDEY
ncbi:11606_t:CDS:2, partial [Cetraspora pellucida]